MTINQEQFPTYKSLSPVLTTQTTRGFRLITPVEVVVNDILQVKFVLECEKRFAVVRKDIVIKWTKRDFVGAEFTSPIDDFESELDFYLLGKRLPASDLFTKE
jgi:hypothetical protein